MTPIDFNLYSEVLHEGRTLFHFTGSDMAVQAIRKAINVADQAIIQGNIDLNLALQHIAAEYKTEVRFEEAALRLALQETAAAKWEGYDSLLTFLPKAGSAYHEVYGDSILDIVKKSKDFVNITINIYLDEAAYKEQPATIFIFDELAHTYLEQYFSACLDHNLGVYWRRTESRRNKHHIKHGLLLTANKKVKTTDIERAIGSLAKILDGRDFTEKFQTYISSFAAKDDVRLEQNYMRLYQDYGLIMGKNALESAITHKTFGNLKENMRAEVRVIGA